jgi:hypothetical protein
MALLQTTLNTVKVGLVEVVAIVLGCNAFCGAFFKRLVKAVVARVVLFRRHSASVPEGDCCSLAEVRVRDKVAQKLAKKLCPAWQ